MERFLEMMLTALDMSEDDSLNAETELNGLDEWDSLGKFTLLSSVFTDYDVTLDVNAVEHARTVGDLWALVCLAQKKA